VNRILAQVLRHDYCISHILLPLQQKVGHFLNKKHGKVRHFDIKAAIT
jgi:hypothetical protein